jgi:1-acyl-sn-glycerol-3-phosphate acyltransferase
MNFLFRIIKAPVDFLVTFILWCYFLLGYSICFIPVLIVMMPFIHDKGGMFQQLNHFFYKGFFIILKCITPGLEIKIDNEVKKLQAAIVISNHRSYLDPLLMISIFPRHKTIVKGIFFKVPVMRWVMKSGGYLPFVRDGDLKDVMIEGIQKMPDFLKNGGVLFIFPEGRRSRNGSLGILQKGAFSIAERIRCPVEVVYINNSDRVFTPGKFFFNTCIKNTITIEWLGTIQPSRDHSIKAREMRAEAVRLFERRIGITGAM